MLVCPGDCIPKEDRTYSTAFSNSVLEHIPNLTPVLKEVHRLLRTGGKLFLTVPTDRLERNTAPARFLHILGVRKLENRYAKFHNTFWNHYHAYPLDKWRKIFNEAGFEVVQEHLYGSPNFSSFYDLLVPFALPSLIAKKTVGRWFFFPFLRKIFSRVIFIILLLVYLQLKKGKGSSLVFYELKRL